MIHPRQAFLILFLALILSACANLDDKVVHNASAVVSDPDTIDAFNGLQVKPARS